MKLSTAARFFLVSALFIGIFIALVVIEHPLGGPFAHTNGVLQFRGRYLSDETTLDLVELSAHGIVFQFSVDKPLIYRTASSDTISAVPVAYSQESNGYVLQFDDGSRFVATADADGNVSWLVEPAASVSQIQLAYRLTRAVSVSLEDGFDGMYLNSDGREWAVSNLHGASDPDRIEFTVVRGKPLPVRMLARETSAVSSILTLLPQQLRSSTEWNAELERWLDKAWTGLSGKRHNSTEVNWLSADGSWAFSNPAYRMQMAELMKRRQYEAATALTVAVRAKQLAAVDWQSAAFAGNTLTVMQAREQADLRRAEATSALLRSDVAELFRQEDLVQFVFDRAPTLSDAFVAMLHAQDFAALPPTQLVYLLLHYQQARQYFSEVDNPFAPVVAQAERLLASIEQVADHFYLIAEAGAQADSRLMLLAGKALLQLGEQKNVPLYISAGQSLLRTLLDNSDATGAVPAAFSISPGTALPSVRLLEAEQLYPYLNPSVYYPRAVSFYRSIGPGSWAWTASPQFAMTRNSENLTFTAEYPVASYHFVTIYGLPAYKIFQLYNINYPMDSMFERYDASGYFYRKDAAVAYIKMRHRAEKETIRLLF
ncbi:MAG: hypothetical protein KKI09_13895 [Spirochaetes bacterium]|nr:hypothetical protein [Spirochaetota bacterium]MBU0956518.1 hypothetical protein [Spirochaetota bacterium]